MNPNFPGGAAVADPAGNTKATAAESEAFQQRYAPMVEGRSRTRATPPSRGEPEPGGGLAAMTPAAGAMPKQVATVTLVCRGVSLTQVLASGSAASANTEIAFALESALKESPLFEAKDTQLTQKVIEDEATGTFTFGLSLKLKRPLKL